MNKWKITSPATGEEIGELVETPLDEVASLFEHARASFVDWSTLPINERIHYIKKLKALLVDKMDELAEVVAKSTGKVKTEAVIADIMPSLEIISYIEKNAERILKRQKVKTPLLLIGKKSFVEYMPRGVVLVIAPWNYPFQLAMAATLSALVSGNSVITKGSEVTPLVGKVMEDLFKEAGFPKDVVQFAHGGKELGAALTAQKPDYIFFTGSVQTGKKIAEVAAKNLIPHTLELGGKDPMIVFEDSNIERAINAALWGAFTNSGQVCMSVERLYVERPIFDEFLTKLKQKLATLKQGTGEEDDIGSMTFPIQKDIVSRHVEDALAKGAKLEAGVHPNDWDSANFIRPIILSNVNHSMEIMNEETFGPVLPIMPFDTEEEAIELANCVEYGLNSSVWTKDEAKANRVAAGLITGAVNINDVIVSFANIHLPFGGAKNSGIGRYHSEAGLRSFCHEKAIVIDSGKSDSEIQWYPYAGKYSLFLSLFKKYFSEQTKWVSFGKDYLDLIKKSKRN